MMRKKTAVSDEISYLQNFIKFQQLRMADRLKLTVGIDGDLNEEKVYPLLFLPLVTVSPSTCHLWRVWACLLI